MKHESIKLEMPCEFINITPINPLISKCEIKVCYVSDKPNRNKSIITKDVAKEMANSLPGSPIVGYYNETKGDFEEHNRVIEISNGQIKFKDTTRPYGFVDLGAKVWFQKFLDDGVEEREYLMTEGYLWTEQYPEAKRILEQGNNQSMELDEKTLDATWTKDINGNPKFFIINEAIISKLCILGEDQEPCFEGATIGQPLQYTLDEDFKVKMFAMMQEIKDLIKEGGTPMFTNYAVEIGSHLWDSLYEFVEKRFPRDLREGEAEDCYRCSKYYIDSVWEENGQKFAILKERETGKLFRMNFIYNDEGLSASEELVEVEVEYVPKAEAPVFSLEDVEAYENNRYSLGKTVQEDQDENQNKIEEPQTEFAKKDDEEDKEDEKEKCPDCGKPIDECECEKEDEDKKKKYVLEEIPEYVELQNSYAALETKNSDLEAKIESLQSQLDDLTAFKADIDKKEKQAMIDNFYMLSDEDKQEVVDNIDKYSVDEIESKLSVICVRNKVSFNSLDNENKGSGTTTFSLNSDDGDFTPAWIKAVQSVAKELK